MRKKHRKERRQGGREDRTRYKSIRQWKTSSYVGN